MSRESVQSYSQINGHECAALEAGLLQMRTIEVDSFEMHVDKSLARRREAVEIAVAYV
jgi:hypothetical protein